MRHTEDGTPVRLRARAAPVPRGGERGDGLCGRPPDDRPPCKLHFDDGPRHAGPQGVRAVRYLADHPLPVVVEPTYGCRSPGISQDPARLIPLYPDFRELDLLQGTISGPCMTCSVEGQFSTVLATIPFSILRATSPEMHLSWTTITAIRVRERDERPGLMLQDLCSNGSCAKHGSPESRQGPSQLSLDQASR